MIPQWLKNYWKDMKFRVFTCSVILGSIVMQISIYIVDLFQPYPTSLLPIAIIGGWGFYFLVFLPIAYAKRNSK